MFLKSLDIDKDEANIRSISFKKGINLIVDETISEDRTESGNNVGKTTVLRLIDYTLGGKGTNIYRDPEFKDKSNKQIEEYLHQHNIVVKLILKEDLDNADSTEIEIRRNFLKRPEKIQEIDGETYSDVQFPIELKKKIFHSGGAKPTFRQIISKNIRDEKNKLTNTLKTLHPTTTKAEYEALFLFWLGIDLDENERKQKLTQKIKQEKAFQSNLRNENSLSHVKQLLSLTSTEITSLASERSKYEVNENYENDLEELKRLKSTISSLSTHLGRLELRRSLITESIQELDNEASQIDYESIKYLYDEAKALIPAVQKTFEETCNFHNEMVLQKKKYISEELPQIENDSSETRARLEAALANENQIAKKLNRTVSSDDLISLVDRLNRLHEQKGGYEEQIRLWNESNDRLNEYETELDRINQGVGDLGSLIDKRVTDFNTYFSVLSDKLYGEKFFLAPERRDDSYELSIGSVSGNLGTGKKKGQIAAFDLAYIQFAERNGIECLHFVLHDQIENVHSNQISLLLTEIVKGINCQYVLPVLREKLPDEINIADYSILKLSQDDKLFKI